MNQYLITIQENQVGQSFIELARNLNFVIKLENVSEKNKIIPQFSKQIPLPKKRGNITDLFGIWKDYNTTLYNIRAGAWPVRK